jgi:hypothetical protein
MTTTRKQAAPAAPGHPRSAPRAWPPGRRPLVAGGLLDGADLFWLAGRASEGGRNTLLRQRGAIIDELTPAPFNVRSRVHEYGGGAVWRRRYGSIFRILPTTASTNSIWPSTTRFRWRSAGGALRFADFVPTARAGA